MTAEVEKLNHEVSDGTLTLCVLSQNDHPAPPEHYSLMGGDDRNPSWDEYKADYKEWFHPHLELIKRAFTELGWIGATAESKANHYFFQFSDGYSISFSWRAWGDLMQAIVDKREGYMAYYM